ncbi:lipopolysaccharide biosynthesis protein [Castellaniella sp.]|uniref:lipopolysaccharide biosynthesis protein n=1 Tax=Castellaniella sp. TaxID=1955812 RepID=UPI003C71399E
MEAVGKSYWRQVTSVFMGAAAAQTVPLAGSLVIARLYAPNEFGLYSTWLGISLILTVCVTCRFEHALGLEPDGAPREKLVVSALFLIVATALVFLLIATLLATSGNVPYWKLPAGLTLLLVPMTMGAGFSSVWQSWAANNGDVRSLSYIRIWLAICVTVLQIVVGWLRPDATALAAAQVLGTWVAGVISYRRLSIRHGFPRSASQAYLWIARSFRRYKRFAMLSLPADLISAASAQLPVIVLTSRFGPEIAGFYALAARMMGAPVSTLGGAIRDVFKRFANEEYRLSGNCRGTYSRTFFLLLVASVLMVLVLYPFSEDLFSIFFGDNWRMAGTVVTWLLPMFALRFISSPLSYTFYIVQKQNVDLIWQICLFSMTVSALTSFDGYKDSLIYYSVGYSVLYIFYVGLSKKYSKG